MVIPDVPVEVWPGDVIDFPTLIAGFEPVTDPPAAASSAAPPESPAAPTDKSTKKPAKADSATSTEGA